MGEQEAQVHLDHHQHLSDATVLELESVDGQQLPGEDLDGKL